MVELSAWTKLVSVRLIAMAHLESFDSYDMMGLVLRRLF
jgi:hypothetical protein